MISQAVVRKRLTEWGFDTRGSLTEDVRDFQIWYHNHSLRARADGSVSEGEYRALLLDDVNYGTAPVKGHDCNYRWGIKNSRYAAGYHTGDDYAAPVGTGVYATRSGSVVRAGVDKAYGRYVVVRVTLGSNQGGAVRYCWYCHLTEALVRIDQSVRFNQMIGKVGATGNVTGPHLHYEERVSPFGYSQNRKPVLDKHPYSSWDN